MPPPPPPPPSLPLPPPPPPPSPPPPTPDKDFFCDFSDCFGWVLHSAQVKRLGGLEFAKLF